VDTRVKELEYSVNVLMRYARKCLCPCVSFCLVCRLNVTQFLQSLTITLVFEDMLEYLVDRSNPQSRIPATLFSRPPSRCPANHLDRRLPQSSSHPVAIPRLLRVRTLSVRLKPDQGARNILVATSTHYPGLLGVLMQRGLLLCYLLLFLFLSSLLHHTYVVTYRVLRTEHRGIIIPGYPPQDITCERTTYYLSIETVLHASSYLEFRGPNSL
jgi:hypothetical protein